MTFRHGLLSGTRTLCLVLVCAVTIPEAFAGRSDYRRLQRKQRETEQAIKQKNRELERRERWLERARDGDYDDELLRGDCETSCRPSAGSSCTAEIFASFQISETRYNNPTPAAGARQCELLFSAWKRRGRELSKIDEDFGECAPAVKSCGIVNKELRLAEAEADINRLERDIDRLEGDLEDVQADLEDEFGIEGSSGASAACAACAAARARGAGNIYASVPGVLGPNGVINGGVMIGPNGQPIYPNAGGQIVIGPNGQPIYPSPGWPNGGGQVVYGPNGPIMIGPNGQPVYPNGGGQIVYGPNGPVIIQQPGGAAGIIQAATPLGLGILGALMYNRGLNTSLDAYKVQANLYGNLGLPLGPYMGPGGMGNFGLGLYGSALGMAGMYPGAGGMIPGAGPSWYPGYPGTPGINPNAPYPWMYPGAGGAYPGAGGVIGGQIGIGIPGVGMPGAYPNYPGSMYPGAGGMMGMNPQYQALAMNAQMQAMRVQSSNMMQAQQDMVLAQQQAYETQAQAQARYYQALSMGAYGYGNMGSIYSGYPYPYYAGGGGAGVGVTGGIYLGGSIGLGGRIL